VTNRLDLLTDTSGLVRRQDGAQHQTFDRLTAAACRGTGKTNQEYDSDLRTMSTTFIDTPTQARNLFAFDSLTNNPIAGHAFIRAVRVNNVPQEEIDSPQLLEAFKTKEDEHARLRTLKK
jgi:hypothetical protein